jgi:hypothetical protein
MIGAFLIQTLPSSIGGDAVALAGQRGAGWRGDLFDIDRSSRRADRAGSYDCRDLPWSYGMIANSRLRACSG